MAGPIKPGIKTTEFAILIFFIVLSVLASLTGMLDPRWAAIANSVISGAYMIGRSMAKMQGLKVPDEMMKPPK